MYAYTAEDNFYALDVIADFQFYDENNKSLYRKQVEVSSDGKYHLDNNDLENVDRITIYPYLGAQEWTFPYNAESYDYYFLGTLTAQCTDKTKSTYKPRFIGVAYSDVDADQTMYYNSEYLTIYNIDGYYYMGFGFYQKVDFESAGNTGIRHIQMLNDIHGNGNKPANLVAEFGIMAVRKDTSELEINRQILNKLSEMESSITGSIDAAGDKVADAIENQYAVSDTEDFGVGQIADQVEEKLGVLSFGADTLNNFLGLFQASNAGSTVLTFPGFTIDVQGESYQVWNDIQFDLTFLEENFGILITAVRTVTVLCVWLAVLGYMVKAYEHLVNNKG